MAETYVTSENSAAAARCDKTAEEGRALLAEAKEVDISSIQTSAVEPLGPPHSALVNGSMMRAAPGMKCLKKLKSPKWPAAA